MLRKNGTTTGRIDAKCSVFTKYDQKRVLCGLKSPTIGFSGRYREISGFSSRPTAIYLSPTSGSCLELQADMHRQVHVHSGMPCEFNHYTHASLARNLHCHIVAMGMTLLQLPNSLSSTKLTEVLSIKHWRQSAFAETLSTTHCSREARRRRASLLVLYKYCVLCVSLMQTSVNWSRTEPVVSSGSSAVELPLPSSYVSFPRVSVCLCIASQVLCVPTSRAALCILVCRLHLLLLKQMGLPLNIISQVPTVKVWRIRTHQYLAL